MIRVFFLKTNTSNTLISPICLDMSTERLIYSPSVDVKGSIDDIGVRISNQSLEALHSREDSASYTSLLVNCLHKDSSIHDAWIKKSHIPFKNIIWCQNMKETNDIGSSKSTSQSELSENEDSKVVEITYIYPSSSSSIKPVKLLLELKDELLTNANTNDKSITSKILEKAYPNGSIKPSILVLINPHGGQGNAVKIYRNQIEPILKAANVKITYMETKYSGHATDFARELNIEEYDIIACCSGDGIPHEVINGFYQRSDKGLSAFNKIAVTQLPCGSGNALSLSTHGSNDAAIATFTMLKLKKTKLDLMAVTQGIGNKEVKKLSFLSQCYGAIADSDIGTEHLRWMGPIRFDLGVAQKTFQKAKYPCELYIDYGTKTKQEINNHFDAHQSKPVGINETNLPLTEESLELNKFGLDQSPPSNWTKVPDDIASNVSIFYVGKMPYLSSGVQFFPAALPNDGFMDLVITDTKTSIFESTKVLLTLDRGTHVYSDSVHHAKIKSYRLIPHLKHPQNHYISVDGENFPFEPLQVELLPKVLTCLLQDGSYVDTCFTK